MGSHILVIAVLFAMASTLTFASDPSPLKDFCVALNDTKDVFVNRKFCKDPELAEADDFFFTGLDKRGNTNNRLGTAVTPVNVNQLAGLNTLGISSTRVDFAPFGLNPPHMHPQGSEILTVLEGTLLAGFVTSNPDNRLFSKLLKKGDVFVFPLGLIHFQLNVGDTNAVVLVNFNSQLPSVVTIANATFDSNLQSMMKFLPRHFKLIRR